MSSPSTRLKVNHLCIRCLCFESVLGDLQEGHFYASLCHLSLCSSTKTLFLCSKSQKTGVPDPKSAQKPRFCARKARKQGVRSQKAHKNPNFVLEKPENGGSRPQKSTKTSILCSKCSKTGVSEAKKAQKPRFCARNARKQGFRTPKEHKNAVFVLGRGRDLDSAFFEFVLVCKESVPDQGDYCHWSAAAGYGRDVGALWRHILKVNVATETITARSGRIGNSCGSYIYHYGSLLYHICFYEAGVS